MMDKKRIVYNLMLLNSLHKGDVRVYSYMLDYVEDTDTFTLIEDSLVALDNNHIELFEYIIKGIDFDYLNSSALDSLVDKILYRDLGWASDILLSVGYNYRDL
jgi:hypothetical protein